LTYHNDQSGPRRTVPDDRAGARLDDDFDTISVLSEQTDRQTAMFSGSRGDRKERTEIKAASPFRIDH
jgi:hypothetical protein